MGRTTLVEPAIPIKDSRNSLMGWQQHGYRSTQFTLGAAKIGEAPAERPGSNQYSTE